MFELVGCEFDMLINMKKEQATGKEQLMAKMSRVDMCLSEKDMAGKITHN